MGKALEGQRPILASRPSWPFLGPRGSLVRLLGMGMGTHTAMGLLCLGCVAPSSVFDGGPHSEPPNIIFILADDLGAMDLGCTGSTFYETPRLDALAAAGMRFTQSYSSSPNCAPTRAAIQTGLYGPRTGVYTVQKSARGKAENRKLVPPANEEHLARRFVTLAEHLRAQNYRTAHIGKWHLGDAPSDTSPERHGYDLNIAGAAIGHPKGYFFPYGGEMPGLDQGEVGEYLTDRLTDEALEFIRENRKRPFFLQLAYYSVHTPIEPKRELVERFLDKPADGGQKNPEFAAMVASLDENVGRVLDELARLGLDGRTVVVFTSDNGGVGGYERAGVRGMREITDNAPLRGGKGMLYEGGVRVPLIVRYPELVQAGTLCDVPTTSVDFLPAFCELANAPIGPGVFCDGQSFVPLLRGERPERLAEREVYWHFPGYLQAEKDGRTWRTTPAAAIRRGSWKWIEFYEDGEGALYDLASDVGEEHDLSQDQERIASILRRRLRSWQRRVDAPFPTRNAAWEFALGGGQVVAPVQASH